MTYYLLLIEHVTQIGPHFDVPFPPMDNLFALGEQLERLAGEKGMMPHEIRGAYVIQGRTPRDCERQYVSFRMGGSLIGGHINPEEVYKATHGMGNPWAGIAKESTQGPVPPPSGWQPPDVPPIAWIRMA